MHLRTRSNRQCLLLVGQEGLKSFSTSSKKQQQAGRHFPQTGHIIQTPSQPAITPLPICSLLSGNNTVTKNIRVFGVIELD